MNSSLMSANTTSARFSGEAIGRRGDVFGLYTLKYPALNGLKPIDAACSLGYFLTEANQDHWILQTGRHAAQIHLYGWFEFEAFISRELKRMSERRSGGSDKPCEESGRDKNGKVQTFSD